MTLPNHEIKHPRPCAYVQIVLDSTLRQKFPPSLTPTTPSYKWVNLERRALGICLHISQDSYAISHTDRRLLSPQDLAPRDRQGVFVACFSERLQLHPLALLQA
jgi:hypothetical protein